MQLPILEARNIVKELGQGEAKVQALRGASLTLFPGEFTLLMGPSGSGKTTLLSILGCILSPSSGSLTIAEETASGLPAEKLADLRRRHIGFIFQAYNLFPTLNALDNVRLGLDVRGFSIKEGRAKAAAALHDVGLDHRLKCYPRTLSGGEKQRVAIARALAPAPSIILADEPTSALDSENGHAVMALLAEIAKKQNRAILAVTHDPRTIPYADRIIEIEDGAIVEQHKKGAHPQRGANIRRGQMIRNPGRKRKANA
jgi:putative ABC transport system ATP-binding protein